MPDYGNLEKNVLVWYPFKDNARILLVMDEKWNKLPYILNESCQIRVCDYAHVLDNQYSEKFDYIVLLDVLGRYGEREKMFDALNEISHQKTIVLVVLDNKYGLKYFCGEVNQYTDIPFFTIFDYPKYNKYKRGYSFDKASIIKILNNAGLKYQKFYYPMPDYRVLQEVYTEERLPGESLHEKILFHFEHPENLVMDEREIYSDVINNGVFEFFSNSFIIECSANKVDFVDISYAAVSGDRSNENAIITTIHNNHRVTKRSMYAEGQLSIKKLKNNMEYLNSRGVKVLEAEYREEEIIMPYIDAPTVSNHIRQLYSEKKAEEIIEIFDRLYSYILMSSDMADDENNVLKDKYPEVDEWGTVLKHAYIEMMPFNCFWYKKDLLFFDQEFVRENFPALFVMYRALRYTYKLNPKMSSVVTLATLRERYNFNDKMWRAFQVEEQVLQKEIKQRELHSEFYKRVNVDKEQIYQRVKHIDPRGYEQREGNVLVRCEGKKIILFGCGKMFEEYMDKYGQVYKPVMIVDNNSSLWGLEKRGLKVQCPEEILFLEKDERMVVICMKYYGMYLQVKEQLKQMGIEEFVWFDLSRDYQGEMSELK